VFGAIRVLEKHDVIISPGGRDRVPYTSESMFAVLRIKHDLEDP
jgi:hypothetical protein